jgi:hypothetical protein
VTPGPEPRDAAWHRALAYALVGVEWDLAPGPRPYASALAAELAAAGWTPTRIADHARSELNAERPWPHPIPDVLRAGLSAAQLHAALGRAREELDLAVLDPRSPSARTALTADERRLMAEVPPHHMPH